MGSGFSKFIDDVGDIIEASWGIIKLAPRLIELITEFIFLFIDTMEWLLVDMFPHILDLVDKFIEFTIYLIDLVINYDYIIYLSIYLMPAYILLYMCYNFINSVVEDEKNIVVVMKDEIEKIN